MKDSKIIIFVIGVLLGAIISTGAFYIYTTTNTNCSNSNTQMSNGQPPEMPNNNSNSSQPPEMPSNDNTQSNNE